MASVIWITVIFAAATCYIYLLSINLPNIDHKTSKNTTLKFPKNIEELNDVTTLLLDYKANHSAYVLLLYISAYLYKQTFAIPGSFFVNLVGGALFGTWPSFLLACLLSATGASCCFLLSKYFGKSFIKKYFPNKLQFLEDKVEENMDSLFFFLLFARLFPMSPNWFLNMAAPIINVPLHLFFLSVFIGLMPYNYICVETGNMLSNIESLDDIFSTEMMFKLAGVACVALIPGLVIRRYHQRTPKVHVE
ncbi:hypothetical protein CHS0354_021105 [Potamilus streckersoni]|uniref:VTT domain-containing protein n=1 Tax=Potamilus streckersoni TaxID=2493646 RepID=A0AAE0SDN5_9BIVA|nr:hypothetical protein CHS0354_021105 [Potamilus streckersoni]